jgi:hypothetical protein
MRTRDILRKAKKLVKLPGSWLSGSWNKCKYDFKDENGNIYATFNQYCLGGAINEALGLAPGFLGDSPDRDRAVKKLGFKNFDKLVEWNDRQKRKHQDILDRLDDAIGR